MNPIARLARSLAVAKHHADAAAVAMTAAKHDLVAVNALTSDTTPDYEAVVGDPLADAVAAVEAAAVTVLTVVNVVEAL